MSSVQLLKSSGKSETVKALAIKGNEGQDCRVPHTCCFCRKVCRSRAVLRVHLVRVHFKPTKLYCDLCPKVSICKDSMIQHITGVHGKKKLRCNICNFKTAYKANFERHKKTHAAKFECKICKKHVTSLDKHLKLHRRQKVPCPICKKMIYKRTIPSHTKLHSKYKCQSCNEPFNTSEDLRRYGMCFSV